jgi:hypothetical protein
MRLNLFKTPAFDRDLVKLHKISDFCAREVCFITQKRLYLHRVFHGIRFKVNNEDWLS